MFSLGDFSDLITKLGKVHRATLAIPGLSEDFSEVLEFVGYEGD